MTTEKTSSTAKKPVVKKVAKKPVVKKEKKLYIAFGYDEVEKSFDVNIGETIEKATDENYFYNMVRSNLAVLDVSNFLYRFEDNGEKKFNAQYVFDDGV